MMSHPCEKINCKLWMYTNTMHAHTQPQGTTLYNTVHTSKSLSSVLALPFDLSQGSWGQCTVVQFYSAPLLSVSLSVGLNTVILYAD